MKVALVHDYLVDNGGAEGTLLVLHELFPMAPIYTAVYDPSTTLEEFRTCDIRVSPLQRLAGSKRRYKYLLPLYPLAFRTMRLDDFDVVISSASAFAKSVRVASSATHLCYCYTPPRFVWYWNEYREREGLKGFPVAIVQALQPYFRRLDLASVQRVNRFLAISAYVRERITEIYQRDATVVYAPVRLHRFRLSVVRGEYFLVVSRLNRYKRIDTVVEAFNQLRLPLLIAGTGPDAHRLQALAGPTVRLLGRVSEEVLRDLYSTCRALVLPGEEDLGLTPLEANASGRPVVALARGGARETVVANCTGILYDEPTVDHLIEAIQQAMRQQFDPYEIRRHAERFGVPQFQQGILKAIEEELAKKTWEKRHFVSPVAS